ncbi:hypothetical protein CB0940_02861 [Cercospora beticola]|uniref:Uncharacterized protein n=1 Tax=Cercospora beticola TaxID=122368 RepID=A0A2G5I4Q8_CERBT|nr:hypothetical protein CB0940_02861 [Cercospora beticola]PIA99748.1 hypothetical protein CB0940_02861 [Cercospora beticola]WPB00014.1 hypothetical protein RHO25_004633 [Cercospora beticola]
MLTFQIPPEHWEKWSSTYQGFFAGAYLMIGIAILCFAYIGEKRARRREVREVHKDIENWQNPGMKEIVAELRLLRQVMATRRDLWDTMPPSYEDSHGNRVQAWDMEKGGSDYMTSRFVYGGQTCTWNWNWNES